MKKFTALFLSFLLLTTPAFAALSATDVFEMRTAGAATNGAGYKPGSTGTDFSQQAAAQYALTGATSSGVGAVILHASAAADMVGNVAYVSGTNFTTGWYEITSVSNGVSITVDRNCTTGVGASGVVNVGGALSSFQDAFLETMVPGNKIWVKNDGTYSASGAINVAAAGTSSLPIKIEGYNTARGDVPTSTNRPTVALSTNTLIFTGGFWFLSNMIVTTSASAGIQMGQGEVRNCKVTQSNASSTSNAVTVSIYSLVTNCELINAAGRGIGMTSDGNTAFGNYLHDSNAGIVCSSGVGFFNIIGNIFDTCATGIAATGTNTLPFIANNTFYGAETPAGTAVTIATADGLKFINNIVYGFTTGVTQTNLMGSQYVNNNDYFNNTTARSNTATGASDIALTPAFVDGPNGDFRVGANMKAVGAPGLFPGGLTTSYQDIGAVQRVEPAAADYPAVGNVRLGTSYNSGGSVGTLNLPSASDVRFGTTYDNGASTGSLDLPATTDVKRGVTYDGASKTGTLNSRKFIGSVSAVAKS